MSLSCAPVVGAKAMGFAMILTSFMLGLLHYVAAEQRPRPRGRSGLPVAVELPQDVAREPMQLLRVMGDLLGRSGVEQDGRADRRSACVQAAKRLGPEGSQ